MKKVILSMVFIFALGSSTLLNASTSSSNAIPSEIPDCYDIAQAYSDAHGGTYESFSAAYDACYN